MSALVAMQLPDDRTFEGTGVGRQSLSISFARLPSGRRRYITTDRKCQKPDHQPEIGALLRGCGDGPAAKSQSICSSLRAKLTGLPSTALPTPSPQRPGAACLSSASSQSRSSRFLLFLFPRRAASVLLLGAFRTGPGRPSAGIVSQPPLVLVALLSRTDATCVADQLAFRSLLLLNCATILQPIHSLPRTTSLNRIIHTLTCKTIWSPKLLHLALHSRV
ncbi:hypothetical protein FKP32DRAFT_1397072 [Trametes sanguinea]|nr:hypothetical protein FKP32DRAFT_1397072 [Trametes sanguinea]